MTDIFDVDHTLLKGNISWEYGKLLFKEGHISPWKMALLVSSYFLHKGGLISMEAVHKASFIIFFKNRKFDRDHINRFLDSLKFNPLVLNRLKNDPGEKILLSSSPDFLIGPLADKLSIKRWGATRYLIDKDQMICEISSVMDGAKKADYLKHLNIALDQATFYTDHWLDMPVLEIVQRRCVVNPHAKLRKKAQRLGWEIIDESSVSSYS